jgi:hypothetical protein
MISRGSMWRKQDLLRVRYFIGPALGLIFVWSLFPSEVQNEVETLGNVGEKTQSLWL